jgi:hypothetical protein
MKKGQTGKLIFDFDVSCCLEVELSTKDYARATAEEFRSWGGKRRILDKKTNQYIPYEGPVYLHFTNKKIDEPVFGINGQMVRTNPNRRKFGY